MEKYDSVNKQNFINSDVFLCAKYIFSICNTHTASNIYIIKNALQLKLEKNTCLWSKTL